MSVGQKKIISIVVPVYNNEGSLKILYELVIKLFQEQLTQYDYEFCFTNDGSFDGSLRVLLKLREKDKQVKIINFTKNFGQNAATNAAQRLSKGDASITISADLQDPVDLIPKMVEKWEEGSHFVVCYREKREDGFLSKYTSLFYYSMLRHHAGKSMPLGGFDYYLFSRKALSYLLQYTDNLRIRSHQYDLFSVGFKPALIPYVRVERKKEFGKSQYPTWKRIFGFIDGVVGTSYLPLRFMSILGFLFASCGFIYAALIVFSWLHHGTPFKGWAPLMVLLLVIGGIIMIMLGVIGEYVWKIFTETRKRPQYFIDEVFD